MSLNLKTLAWWIGPDGSARQARLKGGPLFDEFHGISARPEGRNLGRSRGDLARAYASVVWAYRCIKLRADAVAGIPLILQDRNGEPIPDHPLLGLLRSAHPFSMTISDLLRATEAAYNIWGAAYWLKVKGNGAPARPGRRTAPGGRSLKWLQWLNPQSIEPQVDPLVGITGYKQTIGGQARIYAPDEVIVFRNFNPLDDLGGLSPLEVALCEVNAELNAARYVAAFFANDARPAGLLTTDQPMHDTDLERVQSLWERLFRGAENKWRTIVTGGGMRWQQVSFPPNDLALSELRAEDRRSICAAFGVPPGLAGAWESATYATAREQKASFYEDGILPQLAYIADVLNRSLLGHYPDLVARDARLAWDTDSIAALRESATDRAQRLVTLLRSGVMTRDEVRMELGLPLDAPGSGAVQPPQTAETADQMTESAQPAAPTEAKGRKAVRHILPGPKNKARTVREDLAKWRRFTLRRLKLGKRANRPFKSAVIPAEVYAQIDAALASARTVADVRAAFDSAKLQQPAADRPIEAAVEEVAHAAN